MYKYVFQKGTLTKRYLVSIDKNRTEVWSTDINDAYLFGPCDSYGGYKFANDPILIGPDEEETIVQVKLSVEIVND